MEINYRKLWQESEANYKRKLKDALYWMKRTVEAENKLAAIKNTLKEKNEG